MFKSSEFRPRWRCADSKQDGVFSHMLSLDNRVEKLRWGGLCDVVLDIPIYNIDNVMNDKCVKDLGPDLTNYSH